jgi:hypothetical protein
MIKLLKGKIKRKEEKMNLSRILVIPKPKNPGDHPYNHTKKLSYCQVEYLSEVLA